MLLLNLNIFKLEIMYNNFDIRYNSNLGIAEDKLNAIFTVATNHVSLKASGQI